MIDLFTMMSKLYGVVVCVVWLCGCAGLFASKDSPAGTEALKASAELIQVPAAVEAHVLGPGDVFEVRVFNEPELSGKYQVSNSGSINFPLVGKLSVAELDGSEVAERLRGHLLQFLTSPQVSVFITEFKSKKIYVLGKVKRPGTFAFEDGMNIIQAITIAGGFDPLASKNGTSISRLVKGKNLRFVARVEDIGNGEAPNINLRPGDIVYVPESLF
jgi:protein involved in polysaccharide export with SLBB domain